MRLLAVFLVASAFLLQAAGAFPAGEAGAGGPESLPGRGDPVLAFTHPTTTLLNYTDVEFRGTTQDTDTIASVRLSTDGLIWTPATDTGGATPFSTWSCTLPLSAGDHMVTARANDTSGSETSISINITIDIEGPPLEVYSPRDNALTNLSIIPVSGMTEPGAVVLVGTESATVETDGSFNGSARLNNGANTLRVTARDGAGNVEGRELRVNLDTIPPWLNAQASDTLTNRSSVTVFGDTEPGSSVMVAEREVPVGEFGSFSTSVPLSPGLNAIPVSSRDRAGNWNFALVEVVMDNVLPEVRISWPEDGAVVYGPMVGVCGTASDQSGITHVQVGVDGLNFTLAGGNTTWAGTVQLPEGEHTIDVLVYDRAGNLNRTELRMTYVSTAPDLQPPVLVINGPQPAVRTRPQLVLDGKVSDQSGVSSVQYSLNNRTWRDCTLNATRTGWSASLTLQEGWTTIYVRASDTKNNSAVSTVTVEYTPPPAAPPPSFVPHVLGAVAVGLVALAIMITYNFWKKWSDQPEPGLGEDEAVIVFPGKGLK